MKYLQPSFTLPCSDHISQEEWDRIWGERTFQCGTGEMGVLYWSKDLLSNDLNNDGGVT
jgi:hypothetical protein